MRFHKIITAAAGSAILLSGVVACSSDDVDSAASNASEAATEAATNASEAASNASSNVSSAASDASSNVSEAATDASEAVTGNPENLNQGDLPESIVTAAGQYKDAAGKSAGEFKSAEKLGDTVLAEYENVSFVESPDSHGPQPIIGKIRDTWVAGGALKNKIGVPVEPEHSIDNGWEQKFSKNTMKWSTEDGKNYSDSYAK